MRPGDDWIVWIPPALGYGERPVGPIPANSVLRFRMALHSVTPAPVTPAPSASARPRAARFRSPRRRPWRAEGGGAGARLGRRLDGTSLRALGRGVGPRGFFDGLAGQPPRRRRSGGSSRSRLRACAARPAHAVATRVDRRAMAHSGDVDRARASRARRSRARSSSMPATVSTSPSAVAEPDAVAPLVDDQVGIGVADDMSAVPCHTDKVGHGPSWSAALRCGWRARGATACPARASARAPRVRLPQRRTADRR